MTTNRIHNNCRSIKKPNIHGLENHSMNSFQPGCEATKGMEVIGNVYIGDFVINDEYSHSAYLVPYEYRLLLPGRRSIWCRRS